MSFVQHREVRVTTRKPVTMPFVAPELSPVPVHHRLNADPQDLRDWTDTDVRVEYVSVPRSQPTYTQEMQASTVRYRSVPVRRKASSGGGPSADYRARQLKAAKLAARNAGQEY